MKKKNLALETEWDSFFAYRFIYWRMNIIYHGLYYDIISEDKMFFD